MKVSLLIALWVMESQDHLIVHMLICQLYEYWCLVAIHFKFEV